MVLNDIWRRIDEEVGVYWKGNFDAVPANPGIYAWFYPLRITTPDLDAFLTEVSKVFAFDAFGPDGRALRRLESSLGWRQMLVDIEQVTKTRALTPEHRDVWNRWVESDRFDDLRRVVMRASLLMPPLYIGKTKNLSVRCGQHRAGTGGGDFHHRYETHANLIGATASRVSDLLFFTITTRDKAADDGGNVEGLVEAILNQAATPPYGMR